MLTSTQKLSKAVIEDLAKRLPEQRKTQREAIGALVAAMLEVRSPKKPYPRAGGERWIWRLACRERRSGWICACNGYRGYCRTGILSHGR